MTGVHAFIVRPFGTKNGIDFDRVESELIRPALDALKCSGGTTGEIIKQGNIRVDMFEQLLIANLVVADLSIHNANVFYELGIRHAFRDKRTFLIKSKGDEVPFDVKTDRYFYYDAEDPATRLPELIDALRSTLDSSDKDSPIFQLLPELEPTDPSKLLMVPQGFREDVEQAKSKSRIGNLQLLSSELDGFSWKISGLRLIGRAQFYLKEWFGARKTWNAVREDDESDLEANVCLGTIYQRLGELEKSEQALDRAAKNQELSLSDIAEIQALRARNAKTLWEQDWKKAEGLDNIQEAALISPHLGASLDLYQKGFLEDRNHFYSGLNAFAMAKVMIILAEAQPEIWDFQFDSEREAKRKLDDLKQLCSDLMVGVKLAIKSCREKLKRQGEIDVWAEISAADLAFLSLTEPKRVGMAYKRAIANAPNFAIQSAHDQILRYKALGILEENANKALENIPVKQAKPDEVPPLPRVILFTGHRIDDPGRPEPRFPPEKEVQARTMILETVSKIKDETIIPILGISGGASGGDILFHEICEELGIPTKMYMALPKKEYINASVDDAGYDWVQRFEHLYKTTDPQTLAETRVLPRWLRSKQGYNIWQRSNLWMLHNSLAMSNDNVTLIALWNKTTGDGPGGTEDMIQRVIDRGANFIHLDTRKLLD